MIEIIEQCVKQLLHTEVLDNTFGVMNRLKDALQATAARRDALTAGEKIQLVKILGPLISESIREALHKRELTITNTIIRHKNTVLTACGFAVDESHAEIDPKNYSWNW